MKVTFTTFDHREVEHSAFWIDDHLILAGNTENDEPVHSQTLEHAATEVAHAIGCELEHIDPDEGLLWAWDGDWDTLASVFGPD